MFVPLGGPSHFKRPSNIEPDGLQEKTKHAYEIIKKAIVEEMGNVGQNALRQSTSDNTDEQSHEHSSTTVGARPQPQTTQAENVVMTGMDDAMMPPVVASIGGSRYDASRDPRRRRM